MPDEYIKRSDFTKAIEDWFMSDEDSRSLAEAIADIPAADVAPVRHGRWVKTTGMMPPEFHGHYA